MLFIIASFTLLAWLLGLRLVNTLILYVCFAVNWSTRQYVGHAFSRDVIHGAWNLRHNGLMTWVLLHGEYDLNHHRRPDVSWYYLPRLCRPDDPPRPGYIRHYWRLWLGPRPATAPAPETLGALPLSLHE